MARTENKITIGYEAGICMKPHKLTMKAFGPFADETTVDFDAMGNSIYLICGDTGAGKTTIFDGIMYALYGTASGKTGAARRCACVFLFPTPADFLPLREGCTGARAAARSGP